MILYHGSPKKLKILIPRKANGLNKFENQKAIFLTKSFEQTALFALGKSLKGKTKFALPQGKLIIEGDLTTAEIGYVYEVNVEAKRGTRGDYEYAYNKPIKKFKIHEVKLKDYENKISHVGKIVIIKKEF